jgi:DNA processing protein
MARDAGGRTIAVLASGFDIIYPPNNRSLARRIVESGQGVLITEYPLGVKPVVVISPRATASSLASHSACS